MKYDFVFKLNSVESVSYTHLTSCEYGAAVAGGMAGAIAGICKKERIIMSDQLIFCLLYTSRFV